MKRIITPWGGKNAWRVRFKEFKPGIDATPNDGYAIRILQAYYNDTEGYLSDNSDGNPPKNPMLILLNRDNEARRVELREAIAILRRGKE